MLAKYYYNAGATMANIVADIKMLATGTIDKSLLSADCNQISTTIDNREATLIANWTLHDAAAGTNTQVIKHTRYDNAAKYNYVAINGATANVIYLSNYEAWNETTHIGTNVANASLQATSQLVITPTTGGFIYVAVSPFHICLSTGGAYTTRSSIAVFEYERNDPYDTDTLNLPNSFFIRFGSSASSALYNSSSSDYIGGFCRVKSDLFTDYTGSYASMSQHTGPYDFGNNIVSLTYKSTFCPNLTYPYTYDEYGNIKKIINPIYISNNFQTYTSTLKKDISTKSGIFMVTSSNLNIDDILLIGTDEYVVIAYYYTTVLVIVQKVA